MSEQITAEKLHEICVEFSEKSGNRLFAVGADLEHGFASFTESEAASMIVDAMDRKPEILPIIMTALLAYIEKYPPIIKIFVDAINKFKIGGGSFTAEILSPEDLMNNLMNPPKN